MACDENTLTQIALSPTLITQSDEATGADSQVDAVEMPLPSDPQTFFLGGLFTLAVLVTLYVASTIVLPVMLAFILKLLLQPAVRLLERAYVPKPAGALLAILLALGIVGGLGAGLSVPASTWVQRLPDGVPRLEAHLAAFQGPVQVLQSLIQKAEQLANVAGQKSTVAVQGGLAG